MNVLGTQDTSAAQAASAGGSLTGSAGAAMGKEDFLKLLVTQLKNQDPMNPAKGHEFAAQLAQFSSVEQLISINSSLAENSQMNGMLAQSINSGVAAGLIGKTIRAAGDHITLPAEGGTNLNFNLAEGAQNVTVAVKNAAGTIVRTFELGAHSSGEHSIAWDGLDENGARVSSGTYRFDVAAVDSADEAVAVETIAKGTVERVTFGKDGILLWIGDRSVAMKDVESVE